MQEPDVLNARHSHLSKEGEPTPHMTHGSPQRVGELPIGLAFQVVAVASITAAV
jgi:hypothetical protein